MDIKLTDYERQLIVEFLDCYVSEYGSKSWPDETKDAVNSILHKLGANESTCRYIGGILK